MKTAPLAFLALVSALIAAACATPSSPRSTGGAGRPAGAPSSLPEFSDLRKMPIGHSLVMLSLPDPQPPTGRSGILAAAKPAGAPAAPSLARPSADLSARLPGDQPSLEAIPPSLPPRPRSAALPGLALPLPPPATAAGLSPRAGAKSPAAPLPAATAAPTAKAPTPAVKPVLPATPPSTVPVVDPRAERQPDIARNIVADLGARMEIPFDGTGWTYLGDVDGRDGMLYESRRYEASGLVFVLTTSKPGDFVLRFQKQDLLRGTTNEELVGVKVLPKAAPRPVATSSPPASSPLPAAGAATQAASGLPTTVASQSPAQSLPQNSPPGSAPSPVQGSAPSPAQGSAAQGVAPSGPASAAPAPVAVASLPLGASTAATPAPATETALPTSPEGLLALARKELASGRIASSIAALDRFMSLYPLGMDEVFWLYGAALEQNGPTKDIKRAYAYYKKLRDDYPQSQLWDRAAERISYIERHYFDIR